MSDPTQPLVGKGQPPISPADRPAAASTKDQAKDGEGSMGWGQHTIAKLASETPEHTHAHAHTHTNASETASSSNVSISSSLLPSSRSPSAVQAQPSYVPLSYLQPFQPLPPSHCIPLQVTNDTLLKHRPTCPSIWYVGERDQLFTLPVLDVAITTQFHISTAVVRMIIVFHNTHNQKIDALFLFPTKGTVTNCIARIGTKRVMETTVVSNENVEGIPKKDVSNLNKILTALESDITGTNPFESYVPDLFRLPLTSIDKGEQILIEVDMLETLSFINGRYVWNLPMQFPAGILPLDRPIQQTVRINAYISSIVPSCTVYSDTHALTITTAPDTPYITVQANHANELSLNINISYSLLSQHIIGTLIKESTGVTSSGEEEGNLLLFVTPPTEDMVSNFFGRHVIFLVDRSGSMSGSPFNEAMKALHASLNMLKPIDQFTIVAFDHQQQCYTTDLVFATPDNIRIAYQWIEAFPPDGGGTDIQTPTRWALDVLTHTYTLALSSGSPPILPYIFLITDGAVSNERDICTMIQSNAGPVRMLTFGIGSYCNWYFLKMAAELSRGWNETVVHEYEIYEKVTALFRLAAVPVLTNIEIVMNDVPHCDLFPSPIPDLFVGAPLTIAGKYSANPWFPPTITLKGTLSDGRIVALDIPTTVNESIPVTKVFLRQRLEILTARAWLSQSTQLKNEIVQLSTQYSMPCAHTSLVAYEVDPVRAEAERNKQQNHKISNAEKAALVAVGGAVVIGAALIAFGNIGATMSNLGALGGVPSLLGSGLGQLVSTIGNCPCCGACGCGACGWCGEIFGNVCHCFQPIVETAAGCCGDCVRPIGTIGATICGTCAEHLWKLCECICNEGNITCICDLLCNLLSGGR